MIYNYILLASLIIISIICISFAIYYIVYYSFNNSNNIHYMSAEETAKFLKDDEDNYVSNLSSLDLYARNVNTSKDYIENIQMLSSSFTEGEIVQLNKCTLVADTLLRNVIINDIDYAKYINLSEIANIKWVFSKTNLKTGKGKINYESGLPHTRKNVIFLSNNVLTNDEDELVKILIHEKIHVFQRNNEDIFKNIIVKMGYIELTDEMISDNAELIKQIKYKRSNPDINKKLYKNILTNKISICTYKNDTPSGISDVSGDYYDEHPYEEIAYELSEYIYKKNKIEKYKNI
jgi:ABC-type sugar transport system permease subunit